VHQQGIVQQRSERGALRISQVGFGGFRIEASVPSHKEALRQAIRGGINLIDTCAIYANGQSERCIGEVVAELIEEEVLTRDDVLIVSKVGQLQDELYARFVPQEDPSQWPAELVVLQEGTYGLCIHPEFIAGQITESLERLNLGHVDAYLLHNPENYLLWSKLQGTPREDAQAEVYRRIDLAFRHLEAEVAQGRIKSYGISSNTLHAAADAYEFLSLERLVQIAEGISPQHSFSMVQLPMNIVESGGITEKNHPGERSAIQYAKSKGFTVVVNRPFDAYYENLWLRLTDVDAVTGESASEVMRRVDSLNDLEEELIEALPFALAERKKLSLGIVLQQYWLNYSSFILWDQVWSSFYAPLFDEILTSIRSQEAPDAGEWAKRYEREAQTVFAAIGEHYRDLDHKRIGRIKGAVAGVKQEWAETDTLTQTVIRALRSTEGVDCVLVGMRKDAYVRDVLSELQRPLTSSATDEEWVRLQEAMRSALIQ